MKKIYSFILAMFAVLSASATDYYLIGEFNGWNPSATQFTQATDGSYEVTVADFKGAIKVLTDGSWDGIQYGAVAKGDSVLVGNSYTLQQGEENLKVGKPGFGYRNAKFKLQVADDVHTLTFVSGEEYDLSSAPTTYQIIGGFTNNWNLADAIQFEDVEGVLTAVVPDLNGTFKIISNRSYDEQWGTNWETGAGLEFNVPYVLGAKGDNEPANLGFANPFAGYTNAKLTLNVGEDGTMTLTLVDGEFAKMEADWHIPGTALGWNCDEAQRFSPVAGQENTYEILVPEFGADFKLVYGNWALEFGATDSIKWELNKEYTCTFKGGNIHAMDDEAVFVDCIITLTVNYETAEVKFMIVSEGSGINDVKADEKATATKIIENGQVLIIKDGVRYNMMGVKVE